MQRYVLFLLAIFVFSLIAILAGCGATPTPEIKVQEKVVTQVVTQVVEKQVQVKETVVVEKVVEKPVLITPTPVPTAAGSDMSADQTLRFGLRNFGLMDPAMESGSHRQFIIGVWMPLFIRDNKHNIIPWLATKYEVNADGTVYTVSINPKAVWSDGSPVTAQEAKDYWTYGISPDCKVCYLAVVAGFDNLKGAKDVIDGKSKDLPGIVVKDDKTLEFNLEVADPIFVHKLSMYDTGFAKMEDVKKGPNYSANGTARTNGPFMIKTWNPDTKVYEIVQNPKWWGDKKPKLTRIIGVENPDENVSFIQWQNNELDVVWWLTAIKERLKPTDPTSFYITPNAGNWYFPLRLDLPPMDDINVRKALAWAVDWDKAIAAAYEGSSFDKPQKGWLTAELPCYKPNNWPDFGFNVQKAKDALAASKYKTPDKLGKIRVTTGGQSPNFIRTAEIMQEQWKTNLGITDVEIKPGSLDAWGQDKDAVQIRRSSGGAEIPDGVVSLSNAFSYHKSTFAMKDADLDALLAQLKPMKRDNPQFCGLLLKAEAQFLGDYAFLPIATSQNAMNFKPWVKNMEVNNVFGWYTILDMYIAKH
ncbi:MAG: hypothetical protein HY326_13020 [Chloroflexi bacterium]|nr:hypothetical protein [Chloroflexota bacterium]